MKTINGVVLLRRGALFLAVTQFVLQAVVVFRGIPFITINLTQDDSYYFLQTAWNLPRYGFVTFDGINPTNGVQFLWYWLLVLPACVVSNKMVFLQLAVVLAAACNAACHWPIVKISEQIRRPAAGLLMVAAWMFVTTSTNRFLSLMEMSAHGFVFWWWVLLLLRASHNPARWIRLFSLCCVLIVWARVDNAFFAVVGFAFVVVRWSLAEDWSAARHYLIQAIAIALAGAVVLLGGWWLMGGSLLSVSALIKMEHYDWSYRATGLGALFLLSVWPLASLPVVSGAAVAGAARRTLLTKLRTGHASEWVFLFVAVTLHLTYLGGHLPGYRFWYLTPYLVTCVVLGGVVAEASIASAGRLRRTLLAAVVAPMVFLLIRSPLITQELRIPSLRHSRYQASVWIRQNLPRNAVLASWNAGQLGFFTGRKVINLDGLINSNDYRRDVLGNRAALVDYLMEHDVGFIIDYKHRNALAGTTHPIRSFPIKDDPKNRVIEVRRWHLTPSAEPPAYNSKDHLDPSSPGANLSRHSPKDEAGRHRPPPHPLSTVGELEALGFGSLRSANRNNWISLLAIHGVNCCSTRAWVSENGSSPPHG